MKLIKSLLVILSLVNFIFTRRQFMRPLCVNILLIQDCELQPHCRWNYALDSCHSIHGGVLLSRPGLVVRPYARYGGYVSRGYFNRPSVAVSRPAMNVSRPAMTVSRPISVGRSFGRHRRLRRF